MDTLGPDIIGDEKLRWLYRHWRAKGRERAAALAETQAERNLASTGRSGLSAVDGSPSKWRLPRRDQIDPLELRPGILPHILLAELVEGDALGETVPSPNHSAPPRRRWRFRLVGTVVAQAAGFDPTWHYLDEALPGAYGTYVLGLYETLRRSGKPIYSESDDRAPNNIKAVERATRRLMLPLAAVAETPATIKPTGDKATQTSGFDGKPPSHSDSLGQQAPRPIAEQDPVRFVLSGQVFISHTASEKRGVLDEGPFDPGRGVFIESD